MKSKETFRIGWVKLEWKQALIPNFVNSNFSIQISSIFMTDSLHCRNCSKVAFESTSQIRKKKIVGVSSFAQIFILSWAKSCSNRLFNSVFCTGLLMCMITWKLRLQMAIWQSSFTFEIVYSWFIYGMLQDSVQVVQHFSFQLFSSIVISSTWYYSNISLLRREDIHETHRTSDRNKLDR